MIQIAANLGLQQIDDTKAQLQNLRFGLACCRGSADESRKERYMRLSEWTEFKWTDK
jgi:hypothetical protein